MKRFKFFRRMIVLFFAWLGFSQASAMDSVEKQVELTSQQKTMIEAKREILNRAMQKATEEVVIQLIGLEKYQKNRSKIYTDILLQSEKYIAYFQQSELSGEAENWKGSVKLNVNQGELQKALTLKGYAGVLEGVPYLMPWIQVHFEGTRRDWLNFDGGWNSNSSAKSWQEQLQEIEKVVSKSFAEIGFFVPEVTRFRFREKIRENQNIENISLFQQVTSPWNPHLLFVLEVLEGNGGKGSVRLLMTVYQADNLKRISEVRKEIKSDYLTTSNWKSGDFGKNLEMLLNETTSQVLEVWQKGTLGANTFPIVLSGRMNLKEQENFKESFLSQFRDVKAIRERSIRVDEYRFEIDTGLSFSTLSERLKNFSMDAQMVEYQGPSGDSLKFVLKRKGGNP